jgi:Ran GTPase-activating protein (RanGAP) involved in mRNA processing and transport
VVKKAQEKVASAERGLLKEEGIYKEYVFGNQGAEELAQYLPTTLSLQELELRHNSIKAAGVKHLCEFLKTTTRLRVLDLGRNPIKVKGIAVLAETLKVCTVFNTVSFCHLIDDTAEWINAVHRT